MELKPSFHLSDNPEPAIVKNHQELVGVLLWIVRLRPDIAFAVSTLGRLSTKATRNTIKHAIRIFGYLKGTSNLKLTYRSLKPVERFIVAYSDCGFSNDPISNKSQGGSLIYIGNNLISHYSKVQKLAATSTYEAEALELIRCTKIVLHLSSLCVTLMNGFRFPAVIYTDAKSVRDNIIDSTVKGRSRHYCSKMTFMRECQELGFVTYEKISTVKNNADYLTKPFGRERFTYLRNKTIDPELRGPIKLHIVKRGDPVVTDLNRLIASKVDDTSYVDLDLSKVS